MKTHRLDTCSLRNQGANFVDGANARVFQQGAAVHKRITHVLENLSCMNRNEGVRNTTGSFDHAFSGRNLRRSNARNTFPKTFRRTFRKTLRNRRGTLSFSVQVRQNFFTTHFTQSFRVARFNFFYFSFNLERSFFSVFFLLISIED